MRQKSTIPAPTLALLVAALMIGLYGVDKFLAAQEQNELEQEARNHYVEGQAALRAGKPQDAIAGFARAHAIERTNREYQLALATAQLADRQFVAARDTLNDLLDEDSNDGRANLLMARVLAAEGRFQEADSYYHRAIYGQWLAKLAGEPQQVRLELANLLAEHGSSPELLSELLLLQTAPAQDPATEKQVAQLFLKAGSVQRAADAYRHLISQNPVDVDAHLGLAQAEVLSGNYRAAENAVMSALHSRPYDERIQSQLRMVVKLASLDPTSRRLSTAEKVRRSSAILALAHDELHGCMPNSQPGTVEKVTAPLSDEIVEARLDEAEKLWKQRVQACKQPPAPDDPLALLMRKLAQ